MSSARQQLQFLLVELSLQLLTRVPLLCFASIPSSSHCARRPLSISPRVLASSTCPENFGPHHQRKRAASQSSFATLFDDQLELFLVMAFFKTARFFFSIVLDLDLGNEGEGEEDMDTFIPLLGLNGIIHFNEFPKDSFLLRIQVVVTVPTVRQKTRPLTESVPDSLKRVGQMQYVSI